MKFRKRIQQLAAISDRLPLPASSPRSIMTPTDVAAAFAKAWSKRDADAIADLFVEDADFVNVVGLWWRRTTKTQWWDVLRCFAASGRRES